MRRSKGTTVESVSGQRPRRRVHLGGGAASGVSDYFISAAWGLIWRYALLLAAIVVREAGYHPPLVLVAIFAGVAVTGAAIGVWRSGTRFAAVWRTVTLSVLVVFVAPSLPRVYPYIVVLAVAVATLEPFAAAGRRRRGLTLRRGVGGGAVDTQGDVAPLPVPGPQHIVQPHVFPAIYSSDGRFLWNGAAWVRLPTPAPPRLAAVERQPAARSHRRRRSRW